MTREPQKRLFPGASAGKFLKNDPPPPRPISRGKVGKGCNFGASGRNRRFPILGYARRAYDAVKFGWIGCPS